MLSMLTSRRRIEMTSQAPSNSLIVLHQPYNAGVPSTTQGRRCLGGGSRSLKEGQGLTLMGISRVALCSVELGGLNREWRSGNLLKAPHSIPDVVLTPTTRRAWVERAFVEASNLYDV